jgi:hypothetical protein
MRRRRAASEGEPHHEPRCTAPNGDYEVALDLILDGLKPMADV